jgi:Uma2 family endonuclease
MTFVIDDAFLPATLSAHPMTDEEFSALCAEHPDLNFEMSADGELIVMAPVYSVVSVLNADVACQLHAWAIEDGRGYCCDSSGGFVLPNGARRSPDVSWTLKTRVNELGAKRRKSFWHLCPDFVIEIKSDPYRLNVLREKMREYLEQGAQLGWLINPDDKTVEIFRPGGQHEKLSEANKVEGEDVLSGFVLDLTDVWDPLAD